MALSAHLLLLLLFLELCGGVGALSAPSDLSMKSINMKHTLSWIPPHDQCNTTVLYSVQYQGEFEINFLNGSWLHAAHCQLTSLSQCDLSLELSSNSDYNLRVRAHCGPVLSPWKQLVPPFNRCTTVLLAPKLNLDVQGQTLLVSLLDDPHIYSVRVSLWRKEHEDQVDERVVPPDPAQFDSLLAGEEYCVRAECELPSCQRSSPSEPQCSHIPGPIAFWERSITVAFAVLISVGFLSTVLWFIIHCQPQTCYTFFHKEALPCSLEQWNFQMPIQTQEEHLEQLHTLLIVPEAAPGMNL